MPGTMLSLEHKQNRNCILHGACIPCGYILWGRWIIIRYLQIIAIKMTRGNVIVRQEVEETLSG